MSDEPSKDDRSTPAGDEPAPRRPQRQHVRTETQLCDLCGAPMLEMHCKLICEQCGYTRDCSDP